MAASGPQAVVWRPLIYMVNFSSVKIVNKTESHIFKLHKLLCDFWLWCTVKGIWLSVYHFPGTQNCDADKLYRNINEDSEWELSAPVLNAIIKVYGHIYVVLFASRLKSSTSELHFIQT